MSPSLAAADREEQRRRAEAEAADELRRTELAQIREQAASSCKNMQVMFLSEQWGCCSERCVNSALDLWLWRKLSLPIGAEHFGVCLNEVF